MFPLYTRTTGPPTIESEKPDYDAGNDDDGDDGGTDDDDDGLDGYGAWVCAVGGEGGGEDARLENLRYWWHGCAACCALRRRVGS